jgi:MscS family membrane protein
MDTTIELIHAEQAWIITLFATAVVCSLLYLCASFVLKKLDLHFSHKKADWRSRLIKALKTPLLILIWLVGIVTALEAILQRLHPEGPNNTLKTVYHLVILFSITWFFLRWANNVQHFLMKEKKFHGHSVEKSKVDIIGKLAYLLIWSVSVILALDILGFNIATLITIGGISGLSLGLAGKDVISNFFGGLMIYVTRPFVVGNYIVGSGHGIEGYVEAISWYYTLIVGKDKLPSYVPNSLFSTMVVVNKSRRSHGILEETIGIRYQDAAVLPSIVQEITAFLNQNPDYDNREPLRVYLSRFAASSIEISILAALFSTDTDEIAKIKQDSLLKISEIIGQHGASMAFPTSTIEIPDGVVITRNGE